MLTRKVKNVIGRLTVLTLLILLVSFSANAQHMQGGMHQNMQGMMQNNMMNQMNEMMKNMEGMMKNYDGMMNQLELKNQVQTSPDNK